jgi:hypothetical protein
MLMVKSNEDLDETIKTLKKSIIDFTNINQAVMSKLELIQSEIIKSELDVQKIISIGDDVDNDNKARNEDVIKQIQEAKRYLITEKEAISEEIINSLGIKDSATAILNATEKLDELTGTLKEFLTESGKGIDILKSQATSLVSSVRDIEKITTSLGLNIDYTREVQNIIKFIKENYKRGISIDELIFRFSEKTVKDVLEKGEKLGYWVFKF